MNKIFVFSLFLLGGISMSAQYTETINSNRPGNSQGAFAVGRDVLQLETGIRFGQNDHSLRNTQTTLYGIDYALRYGVGFEQLEISWIGSFLASNVTIPSGVGEYEMKYSNFESNTLGFKYLIYDPYKKRMLEEPNIHSWKAKYRFRWRNLIPVVSMYAGANLMFGDNPYLLPNEPNISPKAALVTQHNYGRWVLVMNFIADKFISDYPTYAGIFTLTHSLNGHMALFGEYQAIKSDYYSDDIFRAGGAYLFGKNFQIDLAGLVNFKDTPSRWQVAVGLSYRLDMHNVDEFIIPKKEKKKEGTGGEDVEKEKEKKIEELKEQGL